MSARCRTMHGTTLLLALSISGAVRLAAQQHESWPLVGALPFTNSIVGDEHAALNPLSSGIPELILIDLARNPAVRTVEPQRLHRVLTMQRLDPQGHLDDEAASHVGRILGAQWMIRGTLTTDGRGSIRIEAYMVDVATVRIEHTAAAEGKLANVASLVGQLAERLSHDMHLAELSREGKRARELTQKASYETTLLFSRAIEARDAGRTQQAITMLQQLLARDPGYAPAQDELARMHSDR